MRHRHLEVPPGTPIEAWPSAAIVDVLDRGDLDDWRPLLRAVAADPNGRLAERVAALVDAFPMYGTSALWRGWLDRCRVRAGSAGRTFAASPASLAGLRRASGLSQAQVGAMLGISQSDVSKLERRADVRLSTLRSYLATLGARLRVSAVTATGEHDLEAAQPATSTRQQSS